MSVEGRPWKLQDVRDLVGREVLSVEVGVVILVEVVAVWLLICITCEGRSHE